MSTFTQPIAALLFPSVLLLAVGQAGCASALGKRVELSATQAALDAQMQETARMERALMEAQAGSRLPAPNAHEPDSEVKIPAQIPVDEPGVVASPPSKAPEEPFAPVEETVRPAARPDEVAVATAAGVLAEDPWDRRDRHGGSSGGEDTLLLKESIDRVARAIEQQTLLGLIESRLADKQRLMDGIRTDLDRRTLGIVDETTMSGTHASSTTSKYALDPRVARQLEALTAGQSALNAQLQAMQADEAVDDGTPGDAGEDDDAAAQRDAAQREAAQREAAQRDAAQRDAAEWEAAEKARRGARSARPAASATPATADDPRVAALEAQLLEIQAARSADQQEARDEAEAQNRRHLAEREQALAANEARYAALAARQRSALDEIEQSRKEQRRAWQFWRKDDPASSTPPPDPAVLQAQIDAMKDATRAEWDELLSRQEAERAAMETEGDSAASDRAALETRLAELTARMEQVTSDSEVDPAELAAMEELAASVEALSLRTGDLETATIARQQRMLARLQPIIDAGLLVSIEEERARIQLPADVIFTSGKATLTPGGLATVDKVGSTLAHAGAVRVQVEGHTDSVPINGSARTNWDLGFDRAKAVLDRAIKQGVPPDRISAASYADTIPVASNDTADGRKLNRRIEIVVLLTD